MSTLKLARRSVFVVICISFIHAIVFGLLFDYKPSITCAVLNPMLINYFSYFFYPVLCGFLPILIASSCSLLAYRNVRRIIRRQINVVRRCLDRQLTAMGLTRVGFFIICKTPFAMYRIYSIEINTDPTDLLRLAIEKMISVVISSLFNPDFAMNFYIFLASSARHRRQVKYVLIKKKFQSWERWFSFNRNQVNPAIIAQTVSIPQLE